MTSDAKFLLPSDTAFAVKTVCDNAKQLWLPQALPSFYGELALLLQATDSPEYPSFRSIAVQELVRHFESNGADSQFFEGSIGHAWLLANLIETDHNSDATEILSHLDAILLESISSSEASKDERIPFELFDGLAGMLFYAIKRHNFTLATALCNALASSARTSGSSGCCWTSVKRGEEVVETGLAHGVASLLVALSHLTSLPAARSMLEEATTWLMGRIRSDGYSCFSVYEFPERPNNLIRSDAGWGHGDAGVALALLCAATALRNDDWRERAIQVGLRSTLRPRKDYIQPPSVNISHGAAGMAHIYHQLYRATSNERFSRAAKHWYDECLYTYKLANPNLPALTANVKYAFLAGHVGVAAVLAAATVSEQPAWANYIATGLPPA